MARRSVLLIVAVLIALVGTSLIVLYVQGIDSRATAGQELVEVLVATEAIEAGDTVDSAQEAGKFEKKQVRRDDLVEGALSSTGSISGLVAIGAIFPGEQLIAKRFGTLGDTDSLVIPDDKMALSVELTDFERVAGFVNPGNEIAIFATVKGAQRISPTGDETKLGDWTRIIVPRVAVVGVGTTSVTSRTTKTEEGDQVVEEVPRTILTVAVTQEQAEKVIHADRTAEVTFALLTEDTSVQDEPGVGLADLMPELFRALP